MSVVSPSGIQTYEPMAERPSSSRVARLWDPIPLAPLVYFRIAYGMIMVWEIWRHFRFKWIGSHYLTGRLLFTYYGFDWVRPWPDYWLYVHFAVTGLAAAGIALGALYRLSTIVFFFAFTYIFLLDQIYYLNHLYLVCLLAFLMIFMPANRALSVDAWLWPRLRCWTVPLWTLLILRFQVGLVYFFGGIAKLNPDWLRGQPVRSWLKARAGLPVLGPLLQTETAVWMIAYGGLLLDLLVVPLLLWRRTRWLAVAGLIIFHLSNAILFQIGIFPWLMLSATLIFFPLSWWSRVNKALCEVESETPAGQSGVSNAIDAPSSQQCDSPSECVQPVAGASPSISHVSPLAPQVSWRRDLTLACLAIYAAVQVLVPFRHWLYPGLVHWTEEGHRFSWHMKLRSKRLHKAEFRAWDPDTGQEWRVPTEPYLPNRELARAMTRPDMVLQLAHAISRDLQKEGRPNVEVHALIAVALNDHPPQYMIDPNVDLGREPRTLRHVKWILPMLKTIPPKPRSAPADNTPPENPEDEPMSQDRTQEVE